MVQVYCHLKAEDSSSLHTIYVEGKAMHVLNISTLTILFQNDDQLWAVAKAIEQHFLHK